MNTCPNNKIKDVDFLTLACDFRDIEDSIIWTLQMLQEYRAKKATELAEKFLKEIIYYKSKNC